MPTDGSPLSRRNFVRGVGAVLAAGAAAPALAACASGGSSAATSGGKTTITFASAKFFAQESIGQIVEEYNNSQKLVTVQYQQLPTPSQSTEVHQQLVQALSQRNGSIDVYTGDIIWISEFAGAGWSAPLNDYFGPSVQAEYFPGVINACTYDGAMHALPWYLDAGMLYYRKDLLDAANIKPPSSWSELVTAAQQLLKAGKVTDGFNWQAKQEEVLVCDLVEFIGSNGGSILAPDGKTVTIAEPNAVEAVQFMYDTFNKDKVAPKAVLSWDEVPSELPFLGGKAAFLRNTSLETQGDQFTGLANVRRLASDAMFWKTWRQTLEFTAVTTIVETLLGLVIALALFQTFRGRGFVRAAVWCRGPSDLSRPDVTGCSTRRLELPAGAPAPGATGELPRFTPPRPMVADIWKTTLMPCCCSLAPTPPPPPPPRSPSPPAGGRPAARA